MANLDAIREKLNRVISDAAIAFDTESMVLAAREAAVAEATEQQVSVALAQQRQWFIDLIDEQLEQLSGAGTNAVLLLTLRERIKDESN